MKKISLLSMLMLSGIALADGTGPGGARPSSGNNGSVTPGFPEPVAPIDTNAIILIIAAVVLIIAMVAYKKMTASKMA
ncbi:hypothetical protein ACQ1Q5_08775 [Ornithobacterium rhinotracheale]